ncbi:MAG: hypothetical protein WC551_06365 [Patescibacteria group bacterium]
MRRVSFFLAVGLAWAIGCSSPPDQNDGDRESSQDSLQTDPQTGVPYATTYQFPILGINASDFGFGFGSMNTLICMARDKQGSCTAYGYHLGHDTQVGKTPYGTEVVAPGDGIVRITTDITFQGYGSTNRANPDYYGCVIVLEHEFADGKPFTSLLGHVQCESGTAYNPTARTGNPKRGAIVRRGQYVGHIGHYWYGAGKSTDWHHIHFGNKRGKFDAASYTRTGLRPWVRGYAARGEFAKSAQTGKLVHAEWMDPIDTVKAYGDPALTPDVGVRHHPPGALLESASGEHYVVTGDVSVSRIPSAVFISDRYDVSLAARVSQSELDCYARGPEVASLGHVTPYQRPGSKTVVMAYDDRHERYDVIRQEALSSWGYSNSDLVTNAAKISSSEQYAAHGYRRLRAGTLVKASDQSEVSVVTPWQTRRPIGTGEIFEKLGFAWERVVSLPPDVIDAVAGYRESAMVDYDSIFDCALPAPCPSDGSCGGGDDPEDYGDDDDAVPPDDGNGGAGGTSSSTGGSGGSPPASTGGSGGQAPSGTEVCNGLDDDGNGLVDEVFQCKLGATDGPPCTSSCGTSGQRVCEGPECVWGSCKPFVEGCGNTIDDDCDGLTDCEDPACQGATECQPKSDAGTPGSGGSGTGNGMTQLHLVYSGPASPGSIKLMAWWQPPSGPARPWADVAECVDSQPGDGKLDCTFNVQSSSSPFEFQVYLPDGRFWGDENCSSGGCGSTVGTVSLSGPNGQLMITLVPNNPNNLPYFNGHVQNIP